jgi:hypothetical protein
MSQITVEPQPRIDTLVTDAATGVQLRRTEYSGVAWYGDKPQVGPMMVVRSQPAIAQSPFFLPDSLPYRADAAASAVVAVSVAIQSAPDGAHQVTELRAGLVADPRNPAVAWVQVQLLAGITVPLGVSYRVDVLVAPGAVLTGDPAAG